ncbi:MAG TPA: DUF2249 domain-containing protein [Bacillota bacterium]|nr:DUF2249 domain-containing protein [Bacillota bacterium]
MDNIDYAIRITAPDIEAKYRHQEIMKAFDDLKSGEFMELTNDHDPKPLHYQFMMEREGAFQWEYTEEGPSWWRVSIGKK